MYTVLVFKIFTVNNRSVTLGNDMANEFNDFFVNIGPSLTQNIHDPQFCSKNNNVQYLTRNPKSAFFTPISAKEIIDIVCNLKNRSSTGFDEIDVSITKRVIHLICYPLCDILNFSMSMGIFPDGLKIAKVIPVFKNGLSDCK